MTRKQAFTVALMKPSVDPEDFGVHMKRLEIAKSLTQEAIAVRAYQIYVRNGRREGCDAKNWEEAQRELVDEATGSEIKLEPMK